MIIDLHCDTLLRLKDNKEDLKSCLGHINLDKMIKGGYMCQCFAVWTHLEKMPNHKEHVDKMIEAFYYNMTKYNEHIKPVTTALEIEENYQKGYISALLTVEDIGVIHSIEELEDLYKKGVRMASITWNFSNDFGHPGTLNNKGLTKKGIELIKKMEELGMIIDVSHLNDQGIWDILEHTKAPFVASHSNVRRLCEISRNLPDDLLIEMKKRGCVVGMNYLPGFVRKGSNVLHINDLIGHIKYLKNLIGIEHIALGSDFDGIDGVLEIKDASYLPILIDALKENAFSDEEIELITYKNALNLFKKVLK